jgi:hypothetical protein
MENQNKAGDLIFRAGDGGSGGNGGDLHIGPGNYQAGNVVNVKNEITVGQLVNFLEPIIKAHPDLSQQKKQTLIDNLKSGAALVKDVAAVAILMFKTFGGQ